MTRCKTAKAVVKSETVYLKKSQLLGMSSRIIKMSRFYDATHFDNVTYFRNLNHFHNVTRLDSQTHFYNGTRC